jgi:glycosyltransferase involved in cell wall biosynthesis
MLSPLPTVAGRPPESGVATYTAALLRSIPSDVETIALAQKHAAPEQAGLANVARVWTPNLLLPFQVRAALSRVKPDLLHLQHEFNLYGGLAQGMLLTLMLMWLRFRGLRTVATIHGVVAPDDVTKEFLARNGLPRSLRLARAAFRFVYRSLDASSDLLVVHHEHFRNVLVSAYGIETLKIVVIPPGAPKSDRASEQSHRRPGRQILCLGFLTGYKRPEILVEVAEEDQIPGTTFIFCVGSNPRIIDSKYRERYADLRRRVQALGPRARWNGYIPDELLDATFDQADVLVLPYTECVSTSAVAALAHASGTRICYSRPLRPLFGSGPLEFELNPTSLAGAIVSALSASADNSVSGFTSWTDAANSTVAAWKRVIGVP